MRQIQTNLHHPGKFILTRKKTNEYKSYVFNKAKDAFSEGEVKQTLSKHTIRNKFEGRDIQSAFKKHVFSKTRARNLTQEEHYCKQLNPMMEEWYWQSRTYICFTFNSLSYQWWWWWWWNDANITNTKFKNIILYPTLKKMITIHRNDRTRAGRHIELPKEIRLNNMYQHQKIKVF